LHPVDADHGHPRIRAEGLPLTAKALREALRSLGRHNVRARVRPPSVLYEHDDLTVWWRPPRPATMLFDSKELGGKRVSRVPLPGLVFGRCMDTMWVIAVKGDERPDDGTPAWIAPFFNTYEDTSVCNGTVRFSEAPDHEHAETMFFASWFTETNQRRVHSLYADGVYALWRDLLDGTLTSFPEMSLAPLESLDHALSARAETTPAHAPQMTVSQWMRAIDGKANR
jgi:PRTRC genetic system protein B